MIRKPEAGASVRPVWSPPPPGWRLGEGEVHVWAIPLAERGDPAALRNILSGDEQERADRFRFERDRRRFVTSRAMLRVVIGRTLGRDPAALRFEYDEGGKPRLEAIDGAPHFNLSHSGGLALIALSDGAPLGIDVEEIRTLSDEARLAERYFAPGERRAYADAGPAGRTRLFFRIWTRKEAALKRSGTGLSVRLSRFDVLDPDAADPVGAEPLTGGGDDGRRRPLFVDLEPAEGYLGALALEVSEPPTIRQWFWTERALDFAPGLPGRDQEGR